MNRARRRQLERDGETVVDAVTIAPMCGCPLCPICGDHCATCECCGDFNCERCEVFVAVPAPLRLAGGWPVGGVSRPGPPGSRVVRDTRQNGTDG